MFKGIKKVVGVLLVMASLLVPSVAFAEEEPTLTIVGEPLVGETLEAVFTGTDGTETYQWYQYRSRMWEPLEGGDTSKYKFPSNMGGNRIQCKVTHNGSTYYAYVDRINIRELSVKITGTPNVGEVLVAEVEPADATVIYQWWVNNEYSPISGATASTYQLTEGDRGKRIGINVTGIENYAGASAGIKFEDSIKETLIKEDIVKPWHEDSLYGKSVYTGDILFAVTDGLDVDTYEWQRSCTVNGSLWWTIEGIEESYVVPKRTGSGGWQNEQGATSAIRLVITEVDGTKHYSYTLHCLDETNPDSGETGESGGDNSGETAGKIEDSLSDVEYATASNATQNDVLVVASQSSTFTVTIPKRITLDGSTGTADYKVTVQGDITGEEVITVAPSKTFEMVSAGKKAIIATVTQVKEAFSVALDTMEGLLEGVVTTGRVEVENLTAGEWEGICTFTIKIN